MWSKDGSWEEKAVDNMDGSWKDEAWTCFFILIIGASFIKPLQPIMKDGFAFLNTAPDFIKYGILASIAASFGLKSIAKIKKMIWFYLAVSRKFIRIGNYFWHLHVEEVRKRRTRDGK